VPHNESEYQDVQLGSIAEFLAARKAVLEAKGITDFNWPEFEERLSEMNHKNADGSRTGDIIAILDSRTGYLAVNSTEEIYPGWHGGPTIAESQVPILFAMPGDSFVKSNGEHTNKPDGLTTGFENGTGRARTNPDKHLRNWHFGQLLNAIITQFRE